MSPNNDRAVRLWRHADGEWLAWESPRNMFADPYIARPVADDEARESDYRAARALVSTFMDKVNDAEADLDSWKAKAETAAVQREESRLGWQAQVRGWQARAEATAVEAAQLEKSRDEWRDRALKAEAEIAKHKGGA